MSLKLFQGSRRKLLKLKRLPQDYHLAAGIPRVENPVSFLAELQLSVPLHSFISNPFFFREPLAVRLYHRNPIWSSTDSSILHIPKCIVLIPLSWKLFCTVFILCLFLWMHFMYFKFHNSKSFYVTCLKKGTKITSYRLTVNLSLNFIATAQVAGDDTQRHIEKSFLFVFCSVYDPPCMHVWSVMYECDKLWRFIYLFIFSFVCCYCGIIVVLSLHDEYFYYYYPHRIQKSHTHCCHCDLKDSDMITVGHRSGRSIARRPLCIIVTNFRLLKP